MMYEIYLVPNDELDGSEEYVDENEDKSRAIEMAKELRSTKSVSVWAIEANDEKGYIKVIAT